MLKRLTIEEFIKRAKKIHGCKYNYDKVVYKNIDTKVKIKCNKCGKIFEQTPYHHINRKQGCPYCAGNAKLTKEEFIKRAREIHKDLYDYSLVEYKNINIKVKIKCNKCGKIFEQTPSTHINKKGGCPYCAGNAKLTTEEFIKRAKEIHGNKYNYDKVNYKNMYTKVEIICSIHGSFWQTPRVHLIDKCGCPKCKTSKGELKILDFLKENDINYIYQYRVKINNRLHIFDFYLPDYNIMIEYQGKQHFESIDFGSKGKQYALKQYEERVERDDEKREYCLNEGIQLLEINYWEFDNIEDILSDELLLKYAS